MLSVEAVLALVGRVGHELMQGADPPSGSLSCVITVSIEPNGCRLNPHGARGTISGREELEDQADGLSLNGIDVQTLLGL